MTPEATTLETVLDEQFDLTPATLKDMLLKMHLTRIFEDAAFQQYALGKVHGTMHLCAGQEAVAVGAIAALRPDDMITSTHRGPAHASTKGHDINTMTDSDAPRMMNTAPISNCSSTKAKMKDGMSSEKSM